MLQDEIVEKLIRYLVDENLQAGDKLPSIREFSAKLKCNPSRIRTAIITLAALGIVDTHSRAGTFVRKLDPKDIEAFFRLFFHFGMLGNEASTIHLYEVKTLLDREVFSAAVKYRTERDLFELEEILRRQEASLGDGHAFLEKDEEFHLRLAEVVRNPVVTFLLNTIQTMLRPYRYDNFDEVVCREAYADHAAVFEAIRRQDAAKAEDLARIHSRNRMVRLIAEGSRDGGT